MEEMVPTKRFELATNTDARQRLDSFRTGVKDFQKKHPEVLGATVFGSMIKGEKATAQSDVDGFLYVDAEKITDKEKLKDPIATALEYRSNLLSELKIPPDETSKYYGDFRPKLLSGEILDDEIKNYLEAKQKYESFKQMIRDTYETDMSDEDRDKLYEQQPPIMFISPELGGIFHARVGSGIEKYRRMFLEKIMALPDEELARGIWNGIYTQLSTMEGRWSEGKRVKLPSTLEEALRIYHSELSEKIVKEKDEGRIAELRSSIFDELSPDA